VQSDRWAFLSQIAAGDLDVAVLGQLPAAHLALGDLLKPCPVQVIALNAGEASDIPRLQEIEKAARSRYLTSDRFSFAAKSPPIEASRLEGGEVIVAEIEGRPVGFVLLNPMDGMLYVANISVDLGMSGRGIGAALIDAAEKRAISNGLAALTLTTFRQPRWNGPWFRRLGFKPMRAEMIGPALRRVLNRHRTFLDMRTRVILWRPISA
jgi:N-acetylglutamate synthase-like GNAT family acetyltransferase